MKRAIDIVGATVLLVVVLPTLLLVALVSAVALRTNPFFVQKRVGRGGREFSFVKIRTLPRAVPRYADKYELADFDIPRVCLLVRNLHLDELPQLIHVVLGQMSLVGPRPEMPSLHATLTPAFAALRTSIRPGCTGLWQVSIGRNGLISETPEFDDYYIRNRSLRLDLWIALRTIRQMLPFVTTRPVRMSDLPPWAPRESLSPRLQTVDA